MTSVANEIEYNLIGDILLSSSKYWIGAWNSLGTGLMDHTLNLPNLEMKSPPCSMVKKTVLPGKNIAN